MDNLILLHYANQYWHHSFEVELTPTHSDFWVFVDDFSLFKRLQFDPLGYPPSANFYFISCNKRYVTLMNDGGLCWRYLPSCYLGWKPKYEVSCWEYSFAYLGFDEFSQIYLFRDYSNHQRLEFYNFLSNVSPYSQKIYY